MTHRRTILAALILASLCSLIANILLSQGNENILPYKSDPGYGHYWHLIDSLQKMGLPKEELEIVEEIRKKSIAENNYAQLVKTLIYYETLENQNKERAPENVIAEIEAEAAKAHYPEKNVLQSMLAEMYWSYYQNNRYRILQRTRLSVDTSTDIATWDAARFSLRSGSLYLASLTSAESLQHTDLSLFDDILTLAPASKNFRSTLYEFLANRAIDFFVNGETGLSVPANKFVMDDANYLGSSEDFLNIHVNTADTFSLLPEAVKLMQDLTRFAVQRKNTNVLADAELTRLNFANQHLVNEHKDSLYMAALRKSELRYTKDTISARFGFEIAKQIYASANGWSPGADTANRWLKKAALEKCREVSKKFPNTTGSANCDILASKILEPALSFTVESVNIPGHPFKILVNYTNTDSIYLRMASAESMEEDIRNSQNNSEFLGKVLAKPVLKQWADFLPASEDYQAHSVEQPLPALKKGTYFLIVSNSPDFERTSDIVVLTHIQISNLGYVSRSNKGVAEVWVHDRTTGKSVKGATVKFFANHYDYTTRVYVSTFLQSRKTDANGVATIAVSGESTYQNYQSLSEKIDFEGDRLNTGDEVYYSNQKPKEEKWYEDIMFFLDRGIYRPGQTVFFKGLCLSTNGEQSRIETGVTRAVELCNTNSQKIAELSVTSNDYGTFTGSFTLPSSGLNGQMSIVIRDKIPRGGYQMHGSKSFRVEDYKRPQFEVKFEPVKGSFRVGAAVNVTGKATGYAGVPVNGAVVQYHVKRRASFPYWFSWRSRPTSTDQEIISAKVETDANGEFKMIFNALPDPTVSKSQQPEYTYSVSADVTDLNGETESSSTTVTIGSVALRVNMGLQTSYSTGDTAAINIITKNLNGGFEPAQGKIQIYRLKDKGLIKRKRLWDIPDQYAMSEDDFHKQFPLDAYSNEDQEGRQEKEEMVMDLVFDTDNDKTFHLSSLSKWKQGRYVAELVTHDKFGTEVKSKGYFTVYDLKSKEMPVTDMFWIQKVKITAEPGQVARVLIGSSEKDMQVLYEVSLKGEIVYTDRIKLSNEKKLVELPVKEEYRGNVEMRFRTVRDCRLYVNSVVITVPPLKKDLQMKFSTFRDKLLPGGKEEWSVKITGPYGEKVAAEMLADMYDASLDVFAGNKYDLNIPNNRGYTGINISATTAWTSVCLNAISHSRIFSLQRPIELNYKYQNYDKLNWFILPLNGRFRSGQFETMSMACMAAPGPAVDGLQSNNVSLGGATVMDSVITKNKEEANSVTVISNTALAAPPGFKARSNFNETAFFYPQLQTDSAGNIVFNFTVPDALTRWKFQGMALTQDFASGFLNGEAITQKDLMINTNAPRFLREDDEIEFTAKISSLTDKSISGKAELNFIDPYTNQNVTASFGDNLAPVSFHVTSGQNIAASWKLKVPKGLGEVTYRITATAGDFTDGEKATLPVLSNRILVTETLPVHVKEGQKKTFTLEKLAHASSSPTLSNHRLTFELTANPIWYAVQALPYMMDGTSDCSEQIFTQYYANSLAGYIANSSPRIQQVFDSWKSGNALRPNLEKNESLKQILLEESPWVMQAHNETERLNRLGLLFDLNKMSSEEDAALKKLAANQSSNGGWPWFKGMPDNRYITQYIITGLGRLKSMGVIDLKKDFSLNSAVRRGVEYMDARMSEDYDRLLKLNVDISKQHIGYFEIQYLYARSFFDDIPMAQKNKQAYEYFMEQAGKYWLSQGKAGEAMIAIILYKRGDVDGYENILRSLQERATLSDEMGMYWIDNVAGYYCYEAPVETQALMIEAFSLNGKHNSIVDDLRTWLLKKKQVQDWKTTKATADACYAILLNGTDWLTTTEMPEVTIGNTRLSASPDQPRPENGTGYTYTTWDGKDIKPEMGNITISKHDKGIAWGALYWQYFEQLDKITPANTPLQLDKKLFLQTNGPAGPVLTPITEQTHLTTGDLVKVRIELRVDRDMDFVQMKDMRASGLEPTSTLSTYKYQSGLGYYESPRDAATNFFFDHLPKGTFVFEYTLRVSQKGNFSNGITSIQSMYAPEFSSHSEGNRIVIH